MSNIYSSSNVHYIGRGNTCPTNLTVVVLTPSAQCRMGGNMWYIAVSSNVWCGKGKM